MKSTLLRWLHDRLYLAHRRHSFQPAKGHTPGFTLLELLIALAVGSMITGTLLFAIVEILQVDQREASRAETQREMKIALDFISTELREAVFVYDGNCLTGSGSPVPGAISCPGVLNYLPGFINSPPDRIPIIAFWRTDELPQRLIQACAANVTQLYADPPPSAINGVPCLSRRSYSLVVYYLDKTNPTGNWHGIARIRRYELTQFNATGDRNQGWIDPTITNNKFVGWPLDIRGTNLQTQGNLPDGSTNLAVGVPRIDVEPNVLVDFVDDPNFVGTGKNAASGITAACPAERSISLPPFVRTPTSGSSSFYACVRGGGIDTSQVTPILNNPGSRNQEVTVFIRGNAAGRSGIALTARQLFEIETRVLTRGSYEKSPAPQ